MSQDTNVTMYVRTVQVDGMTWVHVFTEVYFQFSNETHRYCFRVVLTVHQKSVPSSTGTYANVRSCLALFCTSVRSQGRYEEMHAHVCLLNALWKRREIITCQGQEEERTNRSNANDRTRA